MIDSHDCWSMSCTRVLLEEGRCVAIISPAQRWVQDTWPTSQYPDTIDAKMNEMRVICIMTTARCSCYRLIHECARAFFTGLSRTVAPSLADIQRNIGISNEWHDHLWWRLQHMLSIVSIYDWQYMLQSYDVYSRIDVNTIRKNPTRDIVEASTCSSDEVILLRFVYNLLKTCETSLTNF